VPVCLLFFRGFTRITFVISPKLRSSISLRDEVKKKEREEKAKLKDVNMAAPSFDRKILNEQHQRDQAAKAKERAQPGKNAKFDMANALFGGSRAEG